MPALPALPLRLSLASALLGLHLGALAAPAAPVPVVTFDTTPRAGQHQRQLIEVDAVMKMRAEPGADLSEEQRARISRRSEEMSRMGPMKMTLRMQQTLQVGQPDVDGWLPLTVATSNRSGQMELGGKTTQLPNTQRANASFTARFNPQDFGFELQTAEGSPEVVEVMRKQGSAMVTEALQLYKVLSQRPMKVGDSVELPLNLAMPIALPGANSQLQSTVRYTLVRVTRGVAHFDLGMDMDIAMDAPMPARAAAAAAAAAASDAPAPAETVAPAAAPQTLRMKLHGSGKGTSALRLSDRLPLSSDLTMDMQMSADMPDGNRMNLDMTMAMKARGESLVKAAAAKPATKAKP